MDRDKREPNHQREAIREKLAKIKETLKPYTFFDPQLEEKQPDAESVQLISSVSYLYGLIRNLEDKLDKKNIGDLEIELEKIEKFLDELITKHAHKIIKK